MTDNQRKHPWIETKTSSKGQCHTIRVPGYSRKIFMNTEELRALATAIEQVITFD